MNNKYIDLEFLTEISPRGEAVIKITEDLDSEQSGEALTKAFSNLLEKGKKNIVLDMSQVEVINSYGIGKILSCNEKLKEENGKLVIKDASGFVDEIFKLLMLDNVFEMV
ncbi:MAG: STAS domain-containing protein [Bdellovibrionota bacterium]